MVTEAHPQRILIVDDEPAIRRFLKTALADGEFALFLADNGHAALAAAVTVKPDVILLDLGLPDLDGVEVIKRIRQWSQVPIIVLSVRDREADKVKALDSGADDYLTKPFGVSELLARIRVMLRRSVQQVPEPVIRIDELEVDLARRLVLLARRGCCPDAHGVRTAPSAGHQCRQGDDPSPDSQADLGRRLSGTTACPAGQHQQSPP